MFWIMLLTMGVEPKEPPRIERCEPILYRFDEIDPGLVQAKTKPCRFFFWYRAPSANGWYLDMDAEGGDITTIAIHHSGGGIVMPEQISEICKERIYKPYFDLADTKHVTVDPALKGLPIHSWHVVKRPGEQEAHETFSAYHFLVYPDGTVVPMLPVVNKVGNRIKLKTTAWGTGNWDQNCHTIQICLMGDFTKIRPTPEQLDATVDLVAYYQWLIPGIKVIPHNAIVPTECPGSAWDLLKQMLKIP